MRTLAAGLESGWDRVWSDLTSRQALPDPAVVLGAGAVALALVLWPGTA